MTFKWDVCAKMAANFLADEEEEEEEIRSSLGPTWSEGGGVNELPSSVLKALQLTAFRSGVIRITRPANWPPDWPASLCSKLNLNHGQKNLESKSAEILIHGA